jgi:hypothetical protein|tara:strand:+ start:239 stop:679 length:441 start_codon:yes stop_codon:yes gene_type:complete
MEGASNQPPNENPASLFVGHTTQQNPTYVEGPLWNSQPNDTLSQSGWTYSKATFRKFYLTPSLLFSVPGHIAVFGAVGVLPSFEETGIIMWALSPIVAIIILLILLIIGISKKNKSILYAVLAGVITDTIIWFGSIYYYLTFAGGW